jgi:hypothetical protein
VRIGGESKKIKDLSKSNIKKNLLYSLKLGGGFVGRMTKVFVLTGVNEELQKIYEVNMILGIMNFKDFESLEKILAKGKDSAKLAILLSPLLAKLVGKSSKKCFECYDIVKGNMLFFSNLAGAMSRPLRSTCLDYFNGFSPILLLVPLFRREEQIKLVLEILHKLFRRNSYNQQLASKQNALKVLIGFLEEVSFLLNEKVLDATTDLINEITDKDLMYDILKYWVFNFEFLELASPSYQERILSKAVVLYKEKSWCLEIYNLKKLIKQIITGDNADKECCSRHNLCLDSTNWENVDRRTITIQQIGEGGTKPVGFSFIEKLIMSSMDLRDSNIEEGICQLFNCL